MIPHNFHALSSSLLALPVAIVFTRKLLQYHQAPVAVAAGSPDNAMQFIDRRANTLTEILKGIEGYEHGGLNE